MKICVWVVFYLLSYVSQIFRSLFSCFCDILYLHGSTCLTPQLVNIYQHIATLFKLMNFP